MLLGNSTCQILVVHSEVARIIQARSEGTIAQFDFKIVYFDIVERRGRNRIGQENRNAHDDKYTNERHGVREGTARDRGGRTNVDFFHVTHGKQKRDGTLGPNAHSTDESFSASPNRTNMSTALAGNLAPPFLLFFPSGKKREDGSGCEATSQKRIPKMRADVHNLLGCLASTG